MKLVYKYEVGSNVGSKTIVLPKGAKILCAKAQSNTPHIWALVDTDPSVPSELRELLVVESGRMPVPPGNNYLGTCLLDDGRYVVHVFEILPTPIDA